MFIHRDNIDQCIQRNNFEVYRKDKALRLPRGQFWSVVKKDLLREKKFLWVQEDDFVVTRTIVPQAKNMEQPGLSGNPPLSPTSLREVRGAGLAPS